MRQAIQLDLEGKTVEARVLIQKEIDTAATPAVKAIAQRSMAMSWGFDANCAKAVEYEQLVMAYWVTREKDEPANAFYQQGEMANEAARVCIDSGDLDNAQKWYRKGTELGLKEPGISADRKALWAYRLAHAEARLAARRGNRAEAEKQLGIARTALDAMTDLRKQQEPFMPYLTGYVALYLGDVAKAIAELEKAKQVADARVNELNAELANLRNGSELKEAIAQRKKAEADLEAASSALREANAKLAAALARIAELEEENRRLRDQPRGTPNTSPNYRVL